MNGNSYYITVVFIYYNIDSYYSGINHYSLPNVPLYAYSIQSFIATQ